MRFLGCFLLLLLSPNLFGQTDPLLRFERLSLEEGLSQAAVNAVAQDQTGFLWIATQDGLNRFDGYEFKHFRYKSTDSSSLSNNFVWDVVCDNAGRIWAATEGGLNLYDPEKLNFRRFHSSAAPTSLSSKLIYCLYSDKNGVLWVGTDEGLNRFDEKTGTFKRFFHDERNSNSLSSNSIRSLGEDKNGRLLVGTSAGLNVFRPENESFYLYDKSLKNSIINKIFSEPSGDLWIGSRSGLVFYEAKTGRKKIFRADEKNPYSLISDAVTGLCRDNSGFLWIGTPDGLCFFDADNQKFQPQIFLADAPNSLSNNDILCLFKDREGLIRIGTSGGGLNTFDPMTQVFKHYRAAGGFAQSLPSNNIWSFFAEENGLLWVGTSEGLSRFDRKKGTFKNYRFDPKNPSALPDREIMCISRDGKNNIWIGSYGGLSVLNRETERFKTYTHRVGDSLSLAGNFVMSILQRKNGEMWIGTSDGGISIFEPKTETFRPLQKGGKKSGSLADKSVMTLFEDSRQNVWLGTKEGLSVYLADKEEFINFGSDETSPDSLSNTDVLCIFEDSQKRIWVGTYGGGFNRYFSQAKKFKSYKESDGLINNTVYGILEDKSGFFWMSTNKGLVKFDPDRETFVNFDRKDGLQSHEFNSGAFFKAEDGELFFGGINGFNAFYPEKIKENSFPTRPIFTDFLLFNRPVAFGENSVLKKNIQYTSEIVLNHDDNIFAFVFTALNFRQAEKNTFEYRLDGLNSGNEWIPADYRDRKAVFTNVEPGTYTLTVRALNSSGLGKTTGKSIKIRILPPWYKTLTFRIFAAIVLIGAVIFYVKMREKILLTQKKTLEDTVTIRTAEIMQQNEEILAQAENLKKANEEIRRQKNQLAETLEESAKQNEQLELSNKKLRSAGEILQKSFSELRTGQKKLESMNSELTSALETVNRQTSALQNNHDNITASVNYAARIQSAILPSQGKINELFPESFILYIPRDIVSGDFYWYAKIGELKFVAAVDCTGHGVPGAFMSLLGTQGLDEIIKRRKVSEPGQILTELNRHIISLLNNNQTGQSDSMDMALAVLNTENRTLTFSGAKRPLYYCRNNSMQQIKGNINSVGGFTDRSCVFEQHVLPLDEVQFFYLFTDGFQDQFGGAENKKFMAKRFRDLLCRIAGFKVEEQRQILSEELAEWRSVGRTKQTDDILVIGVRS